MTDGYQPKRRFGPVGPPPNTGSGVQPISTITSACCWTAKLQIGRPIVTDRETLRALIERVEGATGADHAAVIRDAVLFVADYERANMIPRRAERWAERAFLWKRVLEWIDVGAYESAAASLVPKDWQWVCGKDRPENGGAWADVQPNVVGVTKRRAATPALALTAAALRARLAEMEARRDD
jgi:hypothetical protein